MVGQRKWCLIVCDVSAEDHHRAQNIVLEARCDVCNVCAEDHHRAQNIVKKFDELEGEMKANKEAARVADERIAAMQVGITYPAGKDVLPVYMLGEALQYILASACRSPASYIYYSMHVCGAYSCLLAGQTDRC